MKFITICSVIIFSIPVFADKINFCSITLNSSNEIQFFKDNLPSDDFNFIELTSEDSNFDADWMAQACTKHQTTCDILLVSGHFAGEVFFGVKRQFRQKSFYSPLT